MARLIPTLAALGAALMLTVAAFAQADSEDVRAAKLDLLFERLAESEDAAAAEPIEDEIWRIWASSGSDTVDLVMLRGLEALEKQEYAVALDMFSTAIELDPEFAEAWNKRATLYYVIDDYTASISDVGQVLALEPRHWAALAGLGIMMEEIGNNERALEAYRAALEINPHLEDVRASERRLTIEVEGRGI